MTKFSAEDRRFLLEEFGLTAEKIDKMGYDEFNALQDDCFDIEVGEALAADGGEGDLSERGENAVRLVDLLGYVMRDIKFAGRELTA